MYLILCKLLILDKNTGYQYGVKKKKKEKKSHKKHTQKYEYKHTRIIK